MTMLNVEGKNVEVDDSFLSLSPEEQERTVDEIAASLRQDGFLDNEGVMGQINQGIASNVGGLVDFINPLDNFGITGSAKAGLEGAMDAIGSARAREDPQTLGQSLSRGFGEAAGSLIPATGVAKALGTAGGLVGSISDDAFRALSSGTGMISELMAGSGARGAMDAAARAGLPDWAQQVAGISGGMGLGLIPTAGRNLPTVLGARKLGSAFKKAVLPYTESGASEVARQRVQELAGGPDRAGELARRIGENEFGLTPAQQTQDPNMLALEQTAMSADPNLRVRVEQGLRTSNDAASRAVADIGSDPVQAQEFILSRQKAAKAAIQKNLDAAMTRADEALSKAGPNRTETENSLIVAAEVRKAEASALTQERALWDKVPKAAAVPTQTAKSVAAREIEGISRAQSSDVPKVVRDLLAGNDGFGDTESVLEMHGLYSELRRQARSAMAGNDQNKNKARIANAVADAILEDLGAVDGATAIGRTINEARTFSRELHEVFDRGVVGKILKRTLDGDTIFNQQETLKRTIGTGGVVGKVGVEDIDKATIGNAADEPIQDFLRNQFIEKAVSADGTFKPSAGKTYIRSNQELLDKYPQLQDELRAALGAQETVGSRSTRASLLTKAVNDPNASVISKFANNAPEKAIDAVLSAKDPDAAARALVATARKDTTGKAMDGVKGALSSRLIAKAQKPDGEVSTTIGQAFKSGFADPATSAILKQIYTPSEMSRLDAIGSTFIKLDLARTAAPAIGDISGAAPNKVIEFAARIVAANHGASLGNGGSSIQIAAMASNRMKAALGNLQNDKAAKMLMDAVEDPELFKLLLTDPGSIKLDPTARNRLAPYFTGALSSTSGGLMESLAQ